MFITTVISDGENIKKQDLMQNAQGRSIVRKSVKHRKNLKTITCKLKGPAYKGVIPPKLAQTTLKHLFPRENLYIKCVIKVKRVFYGSGRNQQQMTLQVLFF